MQHHRVGWTSNSAFEQSETHLREVLSSSIAFSYSGKALLRLTINLRSPLIKDSPSTSSKASKISYPLLQSLKILYNTNFAFCNIMQ